MCEPMSGGLRKLVENVGVPTEVHVLRKQSTVFRRKIAVAPSNFKLLFLNFWLNVREICAKVLSFPGFSPLFSS